jgi:hypothetical protein
VDVSSPSKGHCRDAAGWVRACSSTSITVSTDLRVKTDLDAEQSSWKIEGPLDRREQPPRCGSAPAGGGQGPNTAVLCHGFCELGAYPVVPVLREVRDFMVEHPDQVIILVIEDYVRRRT